MIRERSAERSFADIGGMWGIDGAHAFLAEDSGSSKITEFDGMAPTDGFVAEHARRQSRVRFVQGDLHDPVSVEEIGPHDIVFCNGVIYHSPHPYLCLEHLHRITNELLILGSHTIPDVPGSRVDVSSTPRSANRAGAPIGRRTPE